MSLGAKILLLMLLITVGTAAAVSWIVTLSVTAYETGRANDQISRTIGRYVRHLDEQSEQVKRIVRTMMEAPAQRSLLQAADDPADTAAREQLKQEVIGHDVQAELASGEGTPAFHVLLDQAGEMLLVACADPAAEPTLGAALASEQIRWPIDAVLGGQRRPVIQYVHTPAGLFLAMGVPLRTQLDEPPSDAYFVGFRVDDEWVRRQLLGDGTGAEETGAPIEAWFVVDDRVVARASSDPNDPRPGAFRSDADVSSRLQADCEVPGRVSFESGGERFIGRSIDLHPAHAAAGRLVLASSLDQALAPLRRLQRSILLTALIACAVAVVACRAIARMISKPIRELVASTQKIAAGQFDAAAVRVRRRDELGVLAQSFNGMALGLAERDLLREERTKIDRDLALARQIQMDVLPKELPDCPGYDLAAFSLPADATGGDIYDLVAMALDPDGQGGPPSLVLLLADATGHGIGPALSVTQVRSMLRIGVRLRADLEDVFGQINRQLCQDLGSDRFVTAFLGLLDPSSHVVNYHSAGQAPLLHFHFHNHRFQWLDSSMLPLGIEEEPWSEGAQAMRLEPGDVLVLLTDGFYECCNEAGEQFGRQRVADVVLKHHHRPARELLDEIREATRVFACKSPQLDDMTAVIIRRLPPE